MTKNKFDFTASPFVNRHFRKIFVVVSASPFIFGNKIVKILSKSGCFGSFLPENRNFYRFSQKSYQQSCFYSQTRSLCAFALVFSSFSRPFPAFFPTSLFIGFSADWAGLKTARKKPKNRSRKLKKSKK